MLKGLIMRIKYPFICTVSVPLTSPTLLESTKSKDENSQKAPFSFEVFFKELNAALCVENLLFNLPVTLEKIKIKKEKEEWIIAEIQIKKMSTELLMQYNYHGKKVFPGEKFHIGFKIEGDKGGSKIVNYASNICSEALRDLMTAIPSFSHAFFKELKGTEYFITEPSVSLKVMKTYRKQLASSKDTFIPRYEHYITAKAQVPTACYSSIYHLDKEAWITRFDFAKLTHFYYVSNNMKVDSIKNTQIHSIVDIPNLQTFRDFGHPTSGTSVEVVSRHIGKQVRAIKDPFLNELFTPNKKGIALDVGSACGDNLKTLEKEFPHLEFFGVEPDLICLGNYSAKKEKTFWMNAETLSEFEECNNSFDYIFICNINVLSNHECFWNGIYSLMKPGGKLMVGLFCGDPYMTTNPKTFTAFIRERFENLHFVELNHLNNHCNEYHEEIEDLKGKHVEAYHSNKLSEDEPWSKENQKIVIDNMAEAINKEFPTCTIEKISKSLLVYANHFRQIFYSATKPILSKDKSSYKSDLQKREFQKKELQKDEFYRYLYDINMKEYQENLSKDHPDRNVSEMNLMAFKAFRKCKNVNAMQETDDYIAFKRSAFQGKAESMFNLAWCYEKGIGIPKDLIAAAAGYSSCIEMGEERGHQGLQRVDLEINQALLKKKNNF